MPQLARSAHVSFFLESMRAETFLHAWPAVAAFLKKNALMTQRNLRQRQRVLSTLRRSFDAWTKYLESIYESWLQHIGGPWYWRLPLSVGGQDTWRRWMLGLDLAPRLSSPRL